MKPVSTPISLLKHLTPINLTNATAMLVLTGHPWIFRNKFSRYEKGLRDGDWLLLLGAGNKELGVGIYADTGLIAVRIFYFGENFSLEILENKINLEIEEKRVIFDRLKESNKQKDSYYEWYLKEIDKKNKTENKLIIGLTISMFAITALVAIIIKGL